MKVELNEKGREEGVEMATFGASVTFTLHGRDSGQSSWGSPDLGGKAVDHRVKGFLVK